jgi:hypothetical protein
MKEIKIFIFLALAFFDPTMGEFSQIRHGSFKRVLDFSDPGNQARLCN